MGAPKISVTDTSRNAQDKIKAISVNYLQLLIDCANDEAVKQDFLNNRHHYLNEKVGMRIPESVAIELDYEHKRHPEIYVKAENGTVFVGEGNLAIEVINELASGEKIANNLKMKEQAEVEVRIDRALQKSRVVVNLPFFDVKNDLLGVVKFNDDSEIVLSTSC